MFKKYIAVKTNEPAGWTEQEDLCWQAMFFNGTIHHRDGYERVSYYETEQEAIEAAKEAEKVGRFFSDLTKQQIKNFVYTEFLDENTRMDIQLIDTGEYRYTLLFFSDDGYYYGRACDGEAYESQTSCYAAAYLHFVIDDND